MHGTYVPTPDDLALAKVRREKKETLAAEALLKPSPLLSRNWLALSPSQMSENPPTQRVKILTWNLLAQCLIRRELFPTSDCLKAGQRETLIHEEILRQNADILCLQEVDRLDKLLPLLKWGGYSHHYASGPRKLHGCLIAFKTDLYSTAADKVIFYDDQSVGMDSGTSRIGSSFKTRNIGYLLALRSNLDEKKGMVVATSHLFWHPRYTYERIRQLAILLREVVVFRKELSVDHWPCIIAGDFNFSPADPAYSLATGDPLLPSQEEPVTASLVIHASRDPRVLEIPKAAVEDESEDADPDRVITNARPPTVEDDLLSIPELVDWFSMLPTLRSAYSDGLHEARKRGYNIPTYGTRVSLRPGRRGSDEPEYTSYTHFWQAVLDYIFFIDSPERPISVLGLLSPLSGPDLHPGLPQKRVSGSDHTCLVAELCW